MKFISSDGESILLTYIDSW